MTNSYIIVFLLLLSLLNKYQAPQAKPTGIEKPGRSDLKFVHGTTPSHESMEMPVLLVLLQMIHTSVKSSQFSLSIFSPFLLFSLAKDKKDSLLEGFGLTMLTEDNSREK